MATAVRTEKKKATKSDAGPKTQHNIGKVVQVIGPVLDVAFESEHLPELYNALRIRGKTDAGVDIDVVVEVQQHIGRNQVRAVAMSSTDAVVRGMDVEDLLPSSPISSPRPKCSRLASRSSI
jgi:F-type H+-transporting ATPase subunit beta